MLWGFNLHQSNFYLIICYFWNSITIEIDILNVMTHFIHKNFLGNWYILSSIIGFRCSRLVIGLLYHIYTLIDVKNDSCWTQKKRGEGMWKEANAKTSLYNMWVQYCIAFILLQWTQCPIFYALYQILMYEEYFRVWIEYCHS